jgi:hypothetical protein
LVEELAVGDEVEFADPVDQRSGAAGVRREAYRMTDAELGALEGITATLATVDAALNATLVSWAAIYSALAIGGRRARVRRRMRVGAAIYSWRCWGCSTTSIRGAGCGRPLRVT